MFANAGPSSEPEYAVGVARLAEELGFDLETLRKNLGTFSETVIAKAG